MICVAIVRHGDYVGNGSFQDPLSERGKNQMKKLRDVIDSHLVTIYGKNRGNGLAMERLTFSFSSAERTLQSSAILKYGFD